MSPSQEVTRENRPSSATAQEGTGPAWAARLQNICGEAQSPRDESSRRRAIEEVWLLLNSAISRYLHIHATKLGWIPDEERTEIAAEKSASLLSKVSRGQWDVSDRVPAEIAAYLSKTTRNALIRSLQEAGRRVESGPEDRNLWDVERVNPRGKQPASRSPDQSLERKEYARALRWCVEQLEPSYVDVVLQRCREAMRRCMNEKGYQPRHASGYLLGDRAREVLAGNHPE